MTVKTQTQSTDQRRAGHAWNVVTTIKEAQKPGSSKPDTKKQKEFGGQVRKAAPRILTSGLGPTLAFLKAKETAPELVQALNDWIHEMRPAIPDNEKGRDLVYRIMHQDAGFLRFATAESLAYLQWLKRFAEAEGLFDDNVNDN